MKSSRLVALLMRLQSTGAATAAELADALEVSVRTVYRDVAALQVAGVPLWTEAGRNGGIRLVDGWRTRLDGLTGDEAAALFLAGVPGAAGELGLSTVLVAAQEKVLATLPAELRGRAGRIRERFHLDAPGWFHHAEPVPQLGTVATAVWSGRQLTIRYQVRTRGEGGRQAAGGGRSRDVQRQVEPLGLVLKAGTWYLVAVAGGDIRTYRVGRIVVAEAAGGAVRRPNDFDLATWWAASSRDFGAHLRTFHCRLRVSPWALHKLPYLVDPDAGRDALDTAGPPDNDGWREVAVATEALEVAADQLTGLGAGVEVIEPLELRRKLAAIGAVMAAHNA